MPDRLYLSIQIRGFSPDNMLHHFGQLLKVFPFSALRPGISALRVYALEEVEPPLFEKSFTIGSETEPVLEAAQEFVNPDCAYFLEGYWDLWHYVDGEWKLTPSRIILICYGPEFENEMGDNLRVELGLEAHFLPQPGVPQGSRMAHSNLKSVMRLAGDLDKNMLIENRRLWSDADDNFADCATAAFLEEEGGAGF